MLLTNPANAHILIAMTIQTEQEPPKHREVQKTPKHRGANGLHDDLVALKVDVATIKERCNHFATKEDVAELRAEIKEDINQLLDAINRAAMQVIVALVGVIVALGGILVTLILK